MLDSGCSNVKRTVNRIAALSNRPIEKLTTRENEVLTKEQKSQAFQAGFIRLKLMRPTIGQHGGSSNQYSEQTEAT